MVDNWKEQQEKHLQEIQYKFSVQYNLLIADYKKLDRDLNEALQDKTSLEEQLHNIGFGYT